MRILLSGDRCLETGARPLLAGILNLSPDSFSGDGGGDWPGRAERLVSDGADMLAVGAESTRPGSAGISCEEETAMLVPAIRHLRARFGKDLVISADTRKAQAAEAALQAGADIINDISGLGDPGMAETVARYGAGLVLMHSRGTPETMQTGENLRYDDVTDDVSRFFEKKLLEAERAGIRRECVMLDPGIGFAKTVEQNLTLIRSAGVFRARFGLPLYYGVSRKSFIGKLTGVDDPAMRDPGTLGVLLYLAGKGVEILRVHDAAGARAALKMMEILEKE